MTTACNPTSERLQIGDKVCQTAFNLRSSAEMCSKPWSLSLFLQKPLIFGLFLRVSA
jgi:hypothetical protein